MSDIKSVTFSARVHRNTARFRIPKRVATCLGLRDGTLFGISVRTPSYRLCFTGELRSHSGFEVYGPALKDRVIPGEEIIVTISPLTKLRKATGDL